MSEGWAAAVEGSARPAVGLHGVDGAGAVAGWIGSGEHLFAAAMHGHWHRALIDSTALVMALAFWRMAVAVSRRAVQGDPHSVWAIRATS